MLQRVSPLPSLGDPSLVKTQAYIDGAWVDGSDGRFEVRNPADGGKLAEVANCGPVEAERAIAAASRAWPLWRSRTAKDRAAILKRWYDLMLANSEDLAKLMTAEQGKPLAESKGVSSNGLPRKANACTERPFRLTRRTNGCWYSRSRSAYAPPSRRGTFPTR
jgi:succinate-semialdehyde dehydrogenase/glutarate-semialdehyde dehydrogenase